jgi:cytochrome P450
MIDEFDLASLPAGFYADPYATYHTLRQTDPVRRMPDGSLFLSRHDDVAAVYRDARTFSSDKRTEFRPKYGAGSRLYEHHTTSLVFNDPPLHTRVRRLMMGALTVRAIAAMEPSLIRLVDRLLDAAAEREEVDLIADFASAIPVEVIGNLLDVPHADRAPLRGWSLAILGALEPRPTEAQLAAGEVAVAEFVDYLRELVADRRKYPGDPAQDVLTRLIQGEGGERLGEIELLQNCIFILNAGHETTTNLIGNGLHALVEWPDQRARLLAEPQLIRSAVEEFLRFDSSNQLGNRISTMPTEIAGVSVAAGTPVTLCIGAANRDPAQFAEPDRLDIGREPNRHLAFGLGVHQCAGMTLARLEGRIAIGRFVQRFPAFRLNGTPVRGGRVRFRGFLSLPVRTA